MYNPQQNRFLDTQKFQFPLKMPIENARPPGETKKRRKYVEKNPERISVSIEHAVRKPKNENISTIMNTKRHLNERRLCTNERFNCMCRRFSKHKYTSNHNQQQQQQKLLIA